jgi:hypothetical protein
MPTKRQPSDAEIEALAEEFRALWRSGDVMIPWLRKHQSRLRSMISDEWSWAHLAEALTRAGITYKTGRPWTADNLRHDVRRASLPLKRQTGMGLGRHGQVSAWSEQVAGHQALAAHSSTDTPSLPVASAPSAPQDVASQPVQASAAAPLSVSKPRFRTVSMAPEIKPHTPTSAELKARDDLQRKILGKD